MSANPPSDELQARLQDFRARFEQLKAEVQKAIIGQEDIIEKTIIAMIAGGHVLLEGVPGLGKTLLVRSLAGALASQLPAIQFTPDLIPADLIGTKILVDDALGHSRFEFAQGPVFCNLLLATRSTGRPRRPSPRSSKLCRSTASPSAAKHGT